MNILIFGRVFSAIVQIASCFFLLRILGRFYFAADKMHLPVILFVSAIALAILSCISYTGAWIILGQHKLASFLKAFIFLNLIPGIFGVLSNFIYP
jgi:hypothetical protein